MGLVEQYNEKFIKQLKTKIFRTLAVVGETFVKDARNSVTQSIYERKPNRKKWELTGNLRSSIGYIATFEGEEKQAFADNKRKGKSKGIEAATESKPDNGLIMVAGMDYAVHVEAKGYDVISNSATKAKDQFDKLIKEVLKV
jgi:hypothetical protein